MNLLRRHTLALPLAFTATVCGLLTAPRAARAEERVEDLAWIDTARGRTVPLRVRWPVDPLTPSPRGQPLVLFSHGLGGTRAGGAVWGQAWAAAGFTVIHLQHPGSDFDALRSPGGLRRAASGQQLLVRLQDVRFVLDEIALRRRSNEPPWSMVRPDAVGLAGHSFGAHTVLGMAGQAYPGMASVVDDRLAAFVALSPAVPAAGDARRAFAGITRPILCITGTRDGDVIGNGTTPERRAAVYAALPDGHKAQLLLREADHLTFAGRAADAPESLRRDVLTRNLEPAHHALVAAVTTDWWRANLLQDTAARARLVHPEGLDAGDVWIAG